MGDDQLHQRWGLLVLICREWGGLDLYFCIRPRPSPKSWVCTASLGSGYGCGPVVADEHWPAM
jgi:hypothetical protein